MIKLKKITKTDTTITCTAYVEDCKLPLHLTLNLLTKEFNDYHLPPGYEWCQSHIAHAKFKLLKMVDENKLEDECTIMWY